MASLRIWLRTVVPVAPWVESRSTEQMARTYRPGLLGDSSAAIQVRRPCFHCVDQRPGTAVAEELTYTRQSSKKLKLGESCAAIDPQSASISASNQK